MQLGNIFRILIDENNWTVSDVFALFTMVLIIAGGIFAFAKWTVSNRTQRANFINQIVEKLRFDDEMVKALRVIEYQTNWYNEQFHNSNSDLERIIDKFLSYLSYICYLKDINHISKKEFSILIYIIERTCSSFEVQSYLWNLYHFAKGQETKCSFQYLISYGLGHNFIDKDFYNSKFNKYTKVLNF